MQYIQGNPLGRGHSVSLLSFKSNSFRPIRQIWGFCSVALICFCCLARCLFCVDNAEVADLLQDGVFDVCTKILSVALMHWLLVLRIANPYINQRRMAYPPQQVGGGAVPAPCITELLRLTEHWHYKLDCQELPSALSFTTQWTYDTYCFWET